MDNKQSGFINVLNKIFGDKPKQEEQVKNEIIQPISNVSVPVLTQTPQIAPENFVVKTTSSGIQYEEKEILIDVRNINLSYGNKVILRDVNFQIKNVVRPGMQQGQIVSIIGQSGMGKTQLFKIIAGLNEIPKNKLEKHTGCELTGEVFIGKNMLPVKAGDVGVVTQSYLMFNHRTIRKNFEIAASKNHKLNSKDKKDMINFYADKFNLTEHIDKYPMQLSGGQQQRASIVQQLLCGGDYMCFDEPFSGLDVLTISKTVSVLKSVSLESEERTLIIVSHDIANSCSISDHVFILGKEEGKPGATIKNKIDLIERDLAWKDPKLIKKTPAFIDLVDEIENLI